MRGPSRHVLYVHDKVVKDDGPAFTQINVAIDKLIPFDPSRAAGVYVLLRESPALRAKYPGPARNACRCYFPEHWLPLSKSIRKVYAVLLGRLLPLFKDEEFLKDATSVASMKAVVAGQQIEIKATREAGCV